MGDVDQQILLKKAFDSCLGCDSGNDLQSCGGDIDIGDEESGMMGFADKLLREISHLFNTN